MTKRQITGIAKTMGIKVSRKRKAELILEIQKTEGNVPCFKSAHGYCDRYDCAWREDCLR